MGAPPGPRAVGEGLIVDVTPPWPFRLVRRGGPDSVSRVREGIFERFLHVDGRPILVRAWERPREDAVRIAAIPAEPAWLDAGRRAVERSSPRRRQPLRPGTTPRWRRKPTGSAPSRAERTQLQVAIERTRHALGLDDDYSDFYEAFRSDVLMGPAIRRVPWIRVRRTFWPWEALAWAITEQLIEAERAHVIQRRIVARWGDACLPPDRDRPLRDVPGRRDHRRPRAGRARGARSRPEAGRGVRQGRARGRRWAASTPAAAGDDRRLLAISEIGPWTVQVLGSKGRGEPDSLPAGDLAYLKHVPRLAGMDRRATVAEVEAFYDRFAPYRGWAGLFTLLGCRHPQNSTGRPLRYHPPNPELEDAA